MEFQRSREWFDRAQKVLAGGVSSHFRALGGPCPLFFTRASGSRIYDADGREYIDYALSQGPMILGHSHPDILAAVTREIQNGQLYGAQHPLEVELAESIQRVVPCAEMVRFGVTGSEAIQTALRLARAHTGRVRFIKFEGHYHGWMDNTLISVSPSAQTSGPRESPSAVGATAGQAPGVLSEVIVLPWNDLELLRRTVRAREPEIAAILMEPVMCNNGCIPPRRGYLEGVRELCDVSCIPLIFDEIITGFRCAPGGAQEFYGVTPDLATFGKALAGGFPISVIAGRERLMQRIARGEVMHAGTFNTYNAGVAAAVASIELLTRDNARAFDDLTRLGKSLMSGIRRIGRDQKENLIVQGLGPMFHVGFTKLRAVHDYRECEMYDRGRYGRLVLAMLKRGIRLIGRGIWYVSTAHTRQDVDRTLDAFSDSLKETRSG